MKTCARNCRHELQAPATRNGGKDAIQRRACSFVAALVVILAVIGLSSCAGYASNAARGGTQSLSTGILSPSSPSLTFGNVPVGSTLTQMLSVTNTGTAAVNISEALIAGAGFTVIGGDPSSSLPVGQSSTIQIQFGPQSPSAMTGTLTVMSNASNSPLTISLSGNGVAAPPLQITTTTLSQASVGNPYSLQLSATGGVTPYQWSISSGSLPQGISLSSAGNLDGMPTSSGSFSFVVQVTDSAQNPQSSASRFRIGGNK